MSALSQISNWTRNRQGNAPSSTGPRAASPSSTINSYVANNPSTTGGQQAPSTQVGVHNTQGNTGPANTSQNALGTSQPTVDLSGLSGGPVGARTGPAPRKTYQSTGPVRHTGTLSPSPQPPEGFTPMAGFGGPSPFAAGVGQGPVHAASPQPITPSSQVNDWRQASTTGPMGGYSGDLEAALGRISQAVLGNGWTGTADPQQGFDPNAGFAHLTDQAASMYGDPTPRRQSGAPMGGPRQTLSKFGPRLTGQMPTLGKTGF